jgi:tetratricopeptide (TPR) repeat protein
MIVLLSLVAILSLMLTVNGQAAAGTLYGNPPVILAANQSASTDSQRGQKASDVIDASEAFLEGWERYRRYNPEDFTTAISYFQRAIELNFNYGRAHAALALLYAESWLNEWSVRMGIGWYAAMEEADRHLKVAMNNPTPLAHRVASLMFTIRGQYEEALGEAERAIALDPKDPSGHEAMARILLFTGKPRESLKFLKAAQQLAPQTDFQFRIGQAQFQMELYEQAAETIHGSTQPSALRYQPYVFLSAAYGHLKREDEAKTAYQTANEIFLTLRDDRRSWRLEQLDDTQVFAKQAADLLRQGLHKAGIGTTQPQVVEASPQGITLRKSSPESSLKEIYEFASEYCRSHGKKSSLISTSSPSYVFGCY